MTKFKKMLMSSLAVISAVSAMSISAFAMDTTVTNVDEIKLVSISDGAPTTYSNDNNSDSDWVALGESVFVYDNDECKQIIQLNEYADTFDKFTVTESGILLSNEDCTDSELVPFYFDASDVSNIYAYSYELYVTWHSDVRLRRTPGGEVIGLLQSGTYFQQTANNQGDWKPGRVLNGTWAGTNGWVSSSLFVIAPDGNPYQ